MWDDGYKVTISIGAVGRKKSRAGQSGIEPDNHGSDIPINIDAVNTDKPLVEGDGMEGDGEWVRI